jgi:hypothetical protein
MKSGSREIQKQMERQVPRIPGEYKKQWISRVARFYGCTPIKAENLYYREGHSVPNEIYLKLTSLRNLNGATPRQTHPHLNELRTKLEEQDKNINRLEKILEREITFKRKLGELLAQH